MEWALSHCHRRDSAGDSDSAAAGAAAREVAAELLGEVDRRASMDAALADARRRLLRYRVTNLWPIAFWTSRTFVWTSLGDSRGSWNCVMFKTILAVSEGGPDAVMTFGLAKRVASLFGAAVDALYVPDKSGRGVIGISPRAHVDALKSRARECERWYREILAGAANNTYTAEAALPPARNSQGDGTTIRPAGGRTAGRSAELARDTVRVAIHDAPAPFSSRRPSRALEHFAR